MIPAKIIHTIRCTFMLYVIAFIQSAFFILFIILERVYPNLSLPRNKSFYTWFAFVGGFAILWMRLFFVFWPSLPNGMITLPLGDISGGLFFFIVYSFFNYWWHRVKHSNKYVWRFIHRFHHCPSKMEASLIFFKHPLEIVLNTLLIGSLAWVFNLSIESIAVALLIEGIIETYHHSNIKTPSKLRWIAPIIQTPEMHLIHHERGLHRYNYVSFLWDFVFKTARIPKNWQGEQGLILKNGIKGIFLCEK